MTSGQPPAGINSPFVHLSLPSSPIKYNCGRHKTSQEISSIGISSDIYTCSPIHPSKGPQITRPSDSEAVSKLKLQPSFMGPSPAPKVWSIPAQQEEIIVKNAWKGLFSYQIWAASLGNKKQKKGLVACSLFFLKDNHFHLLGIFGRKYAKWF